MQSTARRAALDDDASLIVARTVGAAVCSSLVYLLRTCFEGRSVGSMGQLDDFVSIFEDGLTALENDVEGLQVSRRVGREIFGAALLCRVISNLRGINILRQHQLPSEAATLLRSCLEILVLAQRRAIGNPIHDALRARGIPSKSYYQETELDSEIAQERLAIFKLSINRADRIALRWLLGRGSGDFRSGAYLRLRSYCEDTGAAPWDALNRIADGQVNIRHTSYLVERFRAIQNELQFLSEHGDIHDFVQRWLRDEFVGIGELRLLVARIIDDVEIPRELLSRVVEEVSQPEIPPDVIEVRIMSLHKSKGLSSPVVVIAGCVDGLLPGEPDAGTPLVQRRAIMEEQRRLFYVGITRVKADPASNRPGVLLLTGSRTMSLADAMQSNIRPARQRYGQVDVHLSRFINELGPAAPAPIAR